jgi:hypothetical protein
MRWFRTAAAALPFIIGMPAQALASCGAAFCTIDTSWDVQGGWSEPGARIDLRYESINQNQPRSGGRDIAFGEIRRHHDEVFTRSRNWVGTFDYALNADWGFSASLPLVDREHLHIHNHQGEALPESWDFRAAGDLRMLARYRLWAPESRDPPSTGAAGVHFGLKLPTGRIDVRNAAGEAAERSLQPGTGTTDALLGVFVTQSLPLKDLSWFAQGLLQVPLNARERYRPGERVTLDAGLRYDASEQWSLLLQVNTVLRGRDRGVEAEPLDTGGTSVWIAPGASYAATKDLRLYGFLQLPLLQYVNGVQITATKAVVLGINARF